MQPERLDTAAVFERVFALYRRQARVLLPVALILLLPSAALSLAGGVTARALSLAAAVIAAVCNQGIVVLAVHDLEDGVRDLGIVGLFRAVAPVLAPLLWTGILVGLGVFVGALAFVIPGLILLTQWSLAAPVVVIEKLGPTQAIGRSRRLVHGNGWGVFSVLIVTLVIVFAVDVALAATVGGLSDGNAALALANLLGGVLTAPLFALASAVLYLVLRGSATDANRHGT